MDTTVDNVGYVLETEPHYEYRLCPLRLGSSHVSSCILKRDSMSFLNNRENQRTALNLNTSFSSVDKINYLGPAA